MANSSPVFIGSVIMVFFLSLTLNAQYSGGSGNADDPYQIGSAADWLALINNSNHWSNHFILTADIDFGGATITPVAPDGNNPAKAFSYTFTGVLDGKGYVLSNFEIDQPGSDYAGLFGMIDTNGLVMNLGLENVTVTGRGGAGSLCGGNYGNILNCYVISTVWGNNSAGGLCGFNYYSGGISQSYAASSVWGISSTGGLCGSNGGTISQCYASGAVKGSLYLGGLCGENTGTLFDSYTCDMATGDGESSYVGGVCGMNNGSIDQCHAGDRVQGNEFVGGLCGANVGGNSAPVISQSYARGAVTGNYAIGGLCGYNNYGAISQCYATGVVTGNDSAAGGLCGYNELGTLEQCYATGAVTGNGYVGGLCGRNYGGPIWYITISESYATGAVTGEDYVGGLTGWSEADGQICEWSYNDLGEWGWHCYPMVVQALDWVVNSFWDKETSGQEYSSGGEERVTADMKILATFTRRGWDFSASDGDPAVWKLVRPGEDYPRLAWQEEITGDMAGLWGVDGVDLLTLVENWLIENPARGDINGDGIVNLPDFERMSENWLEGK